MSDKLQRLKALAKKAEAIAAYELQRKENLKRLRTLFDSLNIDKVDTFDEIFRFNAINVSGISLADESLGEITPGKYAQMIAIDSVQTDGKRRSKNINLRYFGRVETLNEKSKWQIAEFILRWRLEKSFRNVDRQMKLLKTLETKSSDDHS